MSSIFSRQQRRLREKWFTPEQATIIAYKQQQRNGNLVPWKFQLSEQWRAYSDKTTSALRKQIRKNKYKDKFWFVPNF
jgi:hypothetical protein